MTRDRYGRGRKNRNTPVHWKGHRAEGPERMSQDRVLDNMYTKGNASSRGPGYGQAWGIWLKDSVLNGKNFSTERREGPGGIMSSKQGKVGDRKKT